MSSRQRAQDSKKQKWEYVPYGDYLNAVDDLMELKYGRASMQKELAYIAECQEALCSPEECADSLVKDNWIVKLEC